MDRPAHSIRPRPFSANERSLTSDSTDGLAVLAFFLDRSGVTFSISTDIRSSFCRSNLRSAVPCKRSGLEKSPPAGRLFRTPRSPRLGGRLPLHDAPPSSPRVPQENQR